MDGQGDALIGVAVRNLTTSTGVITDIDGFYAIEAQKGEILEFSYVGYNTVKKEVANSFSILYFGCTDHQLCPWRKKLTFIHRRRTVG